MNPEHFYLLDRRNEDEEATQKNENISKQLK